METTIDVWDWDAWLNQTDQHVTNILDRLNKPTPHLPNKHSPALIDPATGHLTGGELCWVCHSARPHRGRRLPRFRACCWCLQFDRQKAETLGLKMLLPLMHWHSQPILPGSRYPTDPNTVRALTDIWSAASLLDDWRRDNVRRDYALLATEQRHEVHLADWHERFGYGPARSQDRWAHFLGLHFPLHMDDLDL